MSSLVKLTIHRNGELVEEGTYAAPEAEARALKAVKENAPTGNYCECNLEYITEGYALDMSS